MLNHETCGWGEERQIDGRTYCLYEVATYRQNNNPTDNEQWRVNVRKCAREDGYTRGRVLKNSFGECAFYVLDKELNYR